MSKTKINQPENVDLRMMGDRILVIPSSENGERATKGGLVIPATANSEKRLLWGEVIAVGPHTRNIELQDRVLYAPESGYEAEISGNEYIILRERDVQAIADSAQVSSPGMYL